MPILEIKQPEIRRIDKETHDFKSCTATHLSNSKRGIAVDENGKLDEEVSVISSDQNHQYYKLASEGWLADITFERIPSDYVILKIMSLPEGARGDTPWTSGYDAYDRLLSVWKRFAKGLTATHYQLNFNMVAKEHELELIDGDGGALEKDALDFQDSHPVVGTIPVRGLFGAGHQVHAGWIDDVTYRESEIIKAYFNQLICENHDLQVRFRQGKNDFAIGIIIWYSMHPRMTKYGKCYGSRIVSLGEKPYYDANSISRHEALGIT